MCELSIWNTAFFSRFIRTQRYRKTEQTSREETHGWELLERRQRHRAAVKGTAGGLRNHVRLHAAHQHCTSGQRERSSIDALVAILIKIEVATSAVLLHLHSAKWKGKQELGFGRTLMAINRPHLWVNGLDGNNWHFVRVLVVV